MAWTPPDRGKLKERVYFERRMATNDGYGNREGAWGPLVSDRRVQLQARTGGEVVLADRLAGKGPMTLAVPADSGTRLVTEGDRVVDARRPARMWNIRWVGDLVGDGLWIVMELESGVAI